MHKSALFPAIVLLLATLLAGAAPALAGAWATIAVTDMPDDLQAGQPFTVEFMLWQHGNKAVHELQWDGNQTVALEPLLTFTSQESGEEVAVTVEPGKRPGLFTAEVTLPSGGSWQWTIEPEPLRSVTELEPLDVRPAMQARGAGLAMPAEPWPLNGYFALFAALGTAAAFILFWLAIRIRYRRPLD